MIQENARDLGELQKKVDSWHNMGLDDREIAIRSKDEQLKSMAYRKFWYSLEFVYVAIVHFGSLSASKMHTSSALFLLQHFMIFFSLHFKQDKKY